MDYVRLCLAAQKVGVWVELVASNFKVRHRAGDGTLVESRQIVQMRLVHESGRLLASHPVKGLADRDRVAGELLRHVT